MIKTVVAWLVSHQLNHKKTILTLSVILFQQQIQVNLILLEEMLQKYRYARGHVVLNRYGSLLHHLNKKIKE